MTAKTAMTPTRAARAAYRAFTDEQLRADLADTLERLTSPTAPGEVPFLGMMRNLVETEMAARGIA